MSRLCGKRKHPTLLERLFWRWVFFSTFLFSEFLKCEPVITFKPPYGSFPIDNDSDFSQLLDAISTADYHTSSLSTGRPNGSVLQSSIPPVELLGRGSNILTGTSSSERASESSPISCYGRCGDRKSFPCSCTDICIVNGNCCHDMKTQCRSLFESGWSRFKHLLKAEVECSSMTSSFMIMSCPSASSSREDESLELESTTTGGIEVVAQPNFSKVVASQNNEKSSLLSNAFFSLVLNSPVTDATTGLVYRNRSVSRCNGVQDINIQPWLVQVRIDLTTGDINDLGSLNDMVSTEIIVYIPPDSLKSTSLGSHCIRGSKRHCQKNLLTDRPSLESMCLNGSITYYTNKEQGFFDNIHCLVCNVGSENYSSPVTYYIPRLKTFRFSLLASTTSSGHLTLRPGSGLFFVSWATVECSVSAEEQGSDKCNKSKCGEKFEERPDGECRTIKKLVFAIGGGECSFIRSKETESKLLSLLKCYLKTFENAELDAETVKFAAVFDERMNRSLVQMSGFVYVPNFNRDPFTTEHFLRELQILIYDANFCCDPQPLVPVCANSVCRLGDIEVPSLKTTDLSKHLFGVNNPIKNSKTAANSTLIVCGNLVGERSFDIEPILLCLQEPIHMSQIHFFQRASNVSCFEGKVGKHVFHEKQNLRCNGCHRNLTGVWFAFALFLKLIIAT
ncbi:hypothetical protein ElyMa_003407000 [Elysia marginata]|uniref:SMB domain-containing protein n=1 Tax=Elysia marginata TaxID=1093978 RepID=A0AAV4JU52_9GAST|nr:hypothetical protein ElyMa_003407000 [Elysia marginata]